MIYRAVNDLCAVSFEQLKLRHPDGTSVTQEEAVKILLSPPLSFKLMHWGFDETALNMVIHHVGISKYRRGARMSAAPDEFDCSSLIKWFYGQLGIWMPRRSIQQASFGYTVQTGHMRPGDILLAASQTGVNYFDFDPSWGIGHVALLLDHEFVIHSSNKGLRASPIGEILGENMQHFRGFRRVILNREDFFVFRTNPYWEVETSDDFRWLILQNL